MQVQILPRVIFAGLISAQYASSHCEYYGVARKELHSLRPRAACVACFLFSKNKTCETEKLHSVHLLVYDSRHALPLIQILDNPLWHGILPIGLASAHACATQIKGLRDRNSQKCTLSRNGYGVYSGAAFNISWQQIRQTRWMFDTRVSCSAAPSPTFGTLTPRCHHCTRFARKTTLETQTAETHQHHENKKSLRRAAWWESVAQLHRERDRRS